MIHRFLLPLVAVACAALLTSCAAARGEDVDAIGRWTARQDARVEDDPRAVSVLYARVDPHSAQGTVITTKFETPLTFSHLNLACYGSGTINGTLLVTTTDGSTSITFPGLRCGKKPQVLDVPPAATKNVKQMRFTATDSSQATAWQLVART